MTVTKNAARVSPRRCWLHIAAMLCILIALFAGATPIAHGQEESGRRLITRVQPRYPEYLRDHDIGGLVRLTVVVTPSGNVKSVTPIGGNPILVDAAIDAVKQWKYAPSESSETFEVKVEFTPHKRIAN